MKFIYKDSEYEVPTSLSQIKLRQKIEFDNLYGEKIEALKNEGATVHIISNKTGEIKSWDNTDWGKTIQVDKKLSDANANDYHALILPGGVMNPDSLRTNEDALNFVKKPIDLKKMQQILNDVIS